MTKQELQILEDLPQSPQDEYDDSELKIGKNDPKNGAGDYWWCVYGKIHLSGYYSLPALLSDLAKECVKNGYSNIENALLEDTEDVV